MRTGKTIGKILGVILVIGIIAAAVYAWNYFDLSVSDILSWIVKGVGWAMIITVLGGIAFYLGILLIIKVAPILCCVSFVVAVLCLMNGYYVPGFITLVIGCALMGLSFYVD